MSDAVASAKTTRTTKQAAPETPAASTAAPQKTLREVAPAMLKPGDFEESQYAFLDVSAKIPAGMPFEEVFRPTFWANVVHVFKKDIIANNPDRSGAIIHLRTEDHAFYAKLYVRAVLRNGLIVQCIGPSFDPKTGKACPVDLATGMPWGGMVDLDTDAFDLKWNSNRRGFDIIRKSDQQVVADGANFPTRELAVEWINKTARAH